MRIIIESIDKDSFELRGFTPTPSFKARFSSEVFSGVARLIPFSGAPDAENGAEFEVEIAQEAVTGFRLCDLKSPCIEPLSKPGDFRVRGFVSYVAEHPNYRITCVHVSEADFMLSLEDIGELRPKMGSGVEFIAHDLSMWDVRL